MKKYIAWFISGIMMSSVISACEKTDISYQGEEIILHTQNNHASQIYLLKNNSAHVFLYLNHEKRHPSASAGWGSFLTAGHWSAIMVSQPRFQLVCAQMVNNKMQNISCRQVLFACHVDNFDNKSGELVNTTGWIIENKSYTDLVQGITNRKIYPIPALPSQLK